MLGSACQPTLGQTFSQIQEKGSSYAQEVTDAVTNALSDLVKNKLVQIVSVTIQQPPSKPDAGIAMLQWIDLTTGKQSNMSIGP